MGDAVDLDEVLDAVDARPDPVGAAPDGEPAVERPQVLDLRIELDPVHDDPVAVGADGSDRQLVAVALEPAVDAAAGTRIGLGTSP